MHIKKITFLIFYFLDNIFIIFKYNAKIFYNSFFLLFKYLHSDISLIAYSLVITKLISKFFLVQICRNNNK